MVTSPYHSLEGKTPPNKHTNKQTQIYQACSCKIFMLVHVGDICFVLKIFYWIIQKDICNLMSTFRLLRGMSVLRMKAYVLEFGSEITTQRYSFSEIFEIFSWNSFIHAISITCTYTVCIFTGSLYFLLLFQQYPELVITI